MANAAARAALLQQRRSSNSARTCRVAVGQHLANRYELRVSGSESYALLFLL